MAAMGDQNLGGAFRPFVISGNLKFFQHRVAEVQRNTEICLRV